MKYLHNRIKGYTLGSLPEAPVAELETLSRRTAEEGMVLLKNERNVLPLLAGERVSLFGRAQVEYYKSGTGSGGKVNVTHVTNILDSLRGEHPEISVNEDLAKVYADWLLEHPFDRGDGWAKEPWCQIEMPLTDDLVAAAANVSDKAVVVIGRTAGEDKDNSATRGSWYLTEEEETMLRLVTKYFDRVAVVLNVGNIIDPEWIEAFGVDSVLIGWQGGMCGGAATADILCGTVNPSGKLSDTLARIEDYPANGYFGDAVRNVYAEDIYVGYRYFETFAPEKVLYPFGFGLSYTTFETKVKRVSMNVENDHAVTATVQVTNVGDRAGKEVVQIYLGAPQGKLGKPEKVLTAFAKTPLLAPGESETMRITFRVEEFASYDDSGVTGHKSCYVLEAGQYLIYVGTDVRSAEAYAAFSLEEKVVEVCHEALSPVHPFKRMRPDADGNLTYEDVPTRTYDLAQRMIDNRPVEYPFTGDKGIKLVDVRDGKATMEDFIAQFTDSELLEICRGEGMSSPKVTPGTGGCLGGVTDGLIAHGVPIACVTDGPSGLRMESGLKATSMPNGTLMACTWNLPLIEELFVLEGVEMTAYKIDALLGPGINIHRHPLNGRNFEYFSEDPYLTGTMAAAQCRGTDRVGVTCTIKHFCANSQEWHRGDSDSVFSERAAREIYLKPFEIAVKCSDVRSIMTSYNLVNAIHAASNYDLNTTILRDEWGYDGFVMTDWWAQMNEEGGKSSPYNLSLMIRAQNDVFMVDNCSANRADDGQKALDEGRLTRGEAQRCAMNLCRYLMHTHAMERFLANGSRYENQEPVDVSKMKRLTVEPIDPKHNKKFAITAPKNGRYAFVIDYHANASVLAQIPIAIQQGPHRVGFVTATGTDNAPAQLVTAGALTKGEGEIRIICNHSSLIVDSLTVYSE